MKCGNHKCTDGADVTVFWPGQTTVMCVPHAVQAQNIATALGFVVDVRPLEPAPPAGAAEGGAA